MLLIRPSQGTRNWSYHLINVLNLIWYTWEIKSPICCQDTHALNLNDVPVTRLDKTIIAGCQLWCWSLLWIYPFLNLRNADELRASPQHCAMLINTAHLPWHETPLEFSLVMRYACVHWHGFLETSLLCLQYAEFNGRSYSLNKI